MSDCFDPLKLENQLCFPLYVAAKMAKCVSLSPEDAVKLLELLNKLK